MTDILEEFRAAIPANRRMGPGGWLNFCCPSCGDRKYRGGVAFTPTGGWRYYCFNGGCEFNSQPAGWEPENGFGGRARKLFELIGGDVRKIPLAERMKWSTTKFSSDGSISEQGKSLEVVHTLPEVELPDGCHLLLDVYKGNKSANKVMQYARGRMGRQFVEDFPLYWTEKHPYYVIMPYFHYKDKITMDAVLLGCVAARNDRLTEKQINLLKVSGKDIVMVPDCKTGEYTEFLRQAEENNWFVAIPEWTGKSNPDSLKTTDIGRSVVKDGLLFTIELMMKGATRNFVRANIELNIRSV